MPEREQPPEGAFEIDEPEAAKPVGLELEETPGAEKAVEPKLSPEQQEQQKIDAWVREKKAEAVQKTDEFVIGHERRKAEIAALLNVPSVRDSALTNDVQQFLKTFDNFKKAWTMNEGYHFVVPSKRLENDYQDFSGKMEDFTAAVHEGRRLNPGKEYMRLTNIETARKTPANMYSMTPESWNYEAKKALGIT